jgi:hypothetical protein
MREHFQIRIVISVFGTWSCRVSVYGDFSALGFVPGQIVDSRVQHASHPLQNFDAGVAKMLAGVFRPDVIHERFDLRRGDGAKEAAVRVLTGMLSGALLFVHLSAFFHFHC